MSSTTWDSRRMATAALSATQTCDSEFEPHKSKQMNAYADEEIFKCRQCLCRPDTTHTHLSGDEEDEYQPPDPNLQPWSSNI